MPNTIVINLWAGPGAGKTTCAWEIASELKKQGYVTEYVSEYAKELVWDEKFELLDGSYKHQLMLLEEQTKRIERLNGKVDFIVSDSPIMLNAIYFQGTANEKQGYEKMVYDIFSKYHNFSVFIQRAKTNEFEQEGRMHNLNESMKIDEEVKHLMKRLNIYFGTYIYGTVGVAIDNCIYTYNRINANTNALAEQDMENEMEP